MRYTAFAVVRKFLAQANAEVCQMEQLTVIDGYSKCHFCGWFSNNYLKYGPMYKLGKIKAHYYCVLLSNRLIQNGNDDEGILGFLLSDIKGELQRTRKVLCFYCQKGNATIMCANSKCTKSFHLPCGLKNGSSHQFMYQFKSFCHTHKLIQNIPQKIYRQACRSQVICCICHEKVNVRAKQDNLWAPCCLRTWYHRDCLQKFAHSAGYFCRCAACNDSKKFNEWMQKYGIFIPQQDASWELVPNAFEELLFRYNKCDAEECKCPQGRESSTEQTMWEVIVCESCGSQGIHIACGNLKFVNPEWECPACEQITKNIKSKSGVSNSSKQDEGSSRLLKSTELGQKKRRRESEKKYVLHKRKKRKINAEEDQVEIDVEAVDSGEKDDETVPEKVDNLIDPKGTGQTETEDKKPSLETDPQKVLKLIKPGPLSYKLAEIRKVWGDLLTPENLGLDKIEEKSDNSKIELIELNDSDDDVEVVEEIKKETTGEFPILQNLLSINQTEATETKIKAEDCCKPDSPTFSLEKYDVVGVLSLQPDASSNQKTITNHHYPQNGSLFAAQNSPQSGLAKEIMNCMKGTGNYVIISSVCPPPDPGNGRKCTYSLECRPNKTVLLREEKEIVQVIDDEVIILKD